MRRSENCWTVVPKNLACPEHNRTACFCIKYQTVRFCDTIFKTENEARARAEELIKSCQNVLLVPPKEYKPRRIFWRLSKDGKWKEMGG